MIGVVFDTFGNDALALNRKFVREKRTDKYLTVPSFKPFFHVLICFKILETAVDWRVDKNLGCMDHNPLLLVERSFSIFQLLLF